MPEGMARVRIVPFTCEECGKEFAAPAGGLCRSRDRVLCRRHLAIPLLKAKRLRDAPPPLSTTCHVATVNTGQDK